ncbi:hypothetical protein HanXRQr2_Chr08g0359921 [Helianthus annuus]|uniref:Uncharacterized protein n=1 Tax=Helianthus annuus TaxID=4232 RepID=A0A9K3IHY2_HELAN|nr:hypothetical protein HanXRQr2_Chr08g0359921 [Helianthus annuus]KAJ0569794.1 hypothetical protein HanHA300_Chr05g0170621 [Helianthus annuus]KAJ0903291.1 hypothetical protein HanPSC8_Chr08g0347391 [Helianthus annuus]
MSSKLSKGLKLVVTMMGNKLEGLGLPKLKVNLIKTKISHTQGVCVRENDQEKGVRGVNPNPQETIKLKKDFSLN